MSSPEYTKMVTEPARDKRGVPTDSWAWTGGTYDHGISPMAFYTALTITELAKALILGYTMYIFGGPKEATEKKIDTLAALDLGWLYLSVFALKNLAWLINAQQVQCRSEANIGAPDQYVYRVVGQTETPIVLMESDGALGRWNRAQRALQNLNENMAPLVAYAVLAAFVVPKAAFTCTITYGYSRVLYTRGYVNSSLNGTMKSGRFAGFLLQQTALAALEGVILIAGVKSVIRSF